MTMSEYLHIRNEYRRQLENLEEKYTKKEISVDAFKTNYHIIIGTYLILTRPDEMLDPDIFIMEHGIDELRRK